MPAATKKKTIDNRSTPDGFSKLADFLVNNPNVPVLVARLADQFGIKPSDVPTFAPCFPLLKLAKVDHSKISPACLSQAGGLWRAGIAESIRLVDSLNEAALKRAGDTTRVAENGDVRLVKQAYEHQEAPPATPKPKRRGLEILGLPANELLAAMGKAGFSYPAARAAFDELGGLGVRDSAIRAGLQPQEDTTDIPDLTEEQLAELEPFRNAQAPPPKPREARPAPAPAVAPVVKKLNRFL